MNKRAMAVAAVVAATVGASAAGASGAPRTRLPDATLFCGSVTVAADAWVALGSGTLWITSGDLAGHYVVLEQTHYYAEGLLQEPPESYEALMPLIPTETFGKKTGLETTQSCDFVSRWEDPSAPGTGFSIVGPVTIAKVSG
ncbi:hypothetical protein [Intrasporangium sp. DVR]|uniref:hypothetical protein n=1 Tax=Intrasporangium sp. DVR TaxID=3127867 RepID=UPI00313A665C